MRIDPERCVGCGECVDYCPASAIREVNKAGATGMKIREGDCVECGVCKRVGVCPTDALIGTDETGPFPARIQALFSNPDTVHSRTLVPGRGTEESKTNDVTVRYGRDKIGCCIELGRPGTCCTFREISAFTGHLVEEGFELTDQNPLTGLMNPETGKFPEDLLDRRILSCILEIRLPLSRLEELVSFIKGIGSKINTVFSVGIIGRFDEDGGLSIRDRLTGLGLPPAPNAKINLGLGKPLCDEKGSRP